MLVGYSSNVLSAGIHWPMGSTSMPERNPKIMGHQTWSMLSGLSPNTHMQPFFFPGEDYNAQQVQDFVDHHFDSKLAWKWVILYVVRVSSPILS
jgi:hypothetical protein